MDLDALREVINAPVVEFCLLGLGIGIIVSIDVAGLLLSQYNDFRTGHAKPLSAALMHSAWHGGLFLAYMIAIYVSIPLLLEIFRIFGKCFQGLWWGMAWLLLAIFPDLEIPLIIQFDKLAMCQTFGLLVGFFVVVFVWLTYSHKICEDHREKAANEDDLARGLRADVRLIYSALKSTTRFKQIIAQALAATVAVDMLAVSALSKTAFLPSNGVGERDVVATDSVLLDILLFSGIIWGVVFVSSLAAAWLSRSIPAIYRWFKSGKAFVGYIVVFLRGLRRGQTWFSVFSAV